MKIYFLIAFLVTLCFWYNIAEDKLSPINFLPSQSLAFLQKKTKQKNPNNIGLRLIGHSH